MLFSPFPFSLSVSLSLVENFHWNLLCKQTTTTTTTIIIAGQTKRISQFWLLLFLFFWYLLWRLFCLFMRACVRPSLSVFLSCCCFVCLFLLRKNYKNIRQQARRRRAKVKQRNLIAITNFCRLRTNTQTQAHTHRHTHIETHTHTSLFSTHFVAVLEFGQLATFVWSTRTCVRVCMCMCILCVCVLKTKLTTCWAGRQAK